MAFFFVFFHNQSQIIQVVLSASGGRDSREPQRVRAELVRGHRHEDRHGARRRKKDRLLVVQSGRLLRVRARHRLRDEPWLVWPEFPL